MLPGHLQFRDRAVFLPDDRALVLADLHLGRSRTAPVESPLDDAVQLADRILSLATDFGATCVIIAGDVLDAFDHIPAGVTDRFEHLATCLADRDIDFRPIRGNHDTVLDSLYQGTLTDHERVDSTVICHGDVLPDQPGECYIIGHEHPAIRIEGVKYPCYLYGSGVFDGADVIVLPAFTPFARGTVVTSRTEFNSPLVQATDLDKYHPILVQNPTLSFPPLGDLRPFL